ncbi:MAG: YdcF family protein [Polyangiaceae bacterium]
MEPVEQMSLVLLGCRVTGPNTLSPPATRRAWRAVQAFRTGAFARILGCGGKKWQGVREADALCAFLAKNGVPEAALERESWSRSTRQNAHYAASLWLPRGFSRVAIVTCDWHMPRALSCFRGAGFEVEALPALSPQVSLAETLLRSARERASFALDSLVTRGFSRV